MGIMRATLERVVSWWTFGETLPRPIDQVISRTLADEGAAPRVTRTEAMTVPAIVKGRNMVCSVATLPFVQVDAVNRAVPSALLQQIDPDVPNVVTLSQTLEDLLFEGISWWRVTARDMVGWPIAARHLSPDQVSLLPPAGRTPSPLPSGEDPRAGRGRTLWVDGVETPASELIRFDSPNPGILRVGGRSVRRAVLLDKAARMYAADPRPIGYFSPADGINGDPVTDGKVKALLRKWRAWRQEGAVGYVPYALKYNTVDQMTPADLQLVELQRQAALELANLIGLDPEDLGISTTSRTYQNATDRRQDRINEALSPYITAVTSRLSMGDISRPDLRVIIDLNGYLRADPRTRAEVHEIEYRNGWITAEEIRAEEGRPPLPAGYTAPAPPAAAGSAFSAVTFDAATTAVEFSGQSAAFAVNTAARTVEGIVIPFGRKAYKMGQWFEFAPGSLRFRDLQRVKLLLDHDHAQAIGRCVHAEERADGVFARFRVAPGPRGDEALALAAEGVRDGFSVGVEFTRVTPKPREPGVMLALEATWRETSLLAMPAFDDARVSRVEASADGGQMNPCATCGQQHQAGMTYDHLYSVQQQHVPAPMALSAAAVQQFVPAPVQQPVQQQAQPHGQSFHVPTVAAPAAPAHQAPAGPPAGAPAQPDYAALGAAVFGALGGLPAAGVAPAAGGPAVIDPTRGLPGVQVADPAPYRFDRDGALQPAAHDFGFDMIAACKDREPAAMQRVMDFIAAQFDVATGDVNELNPTIQQNRYIDQREYRSPIWSVINKGAPPNGVQPFSWPKFSTASGLVGNHTEGVEPTSGTFVTTNQTVTPTAVSGKAKITRETWDMGGMPGIGNLIWRQMVRGYQEALEAAAVAVLDAASPAALATFTAGGGTTGQTLAAELRAAMARLHYIRGGFRFTDGFAQVDLYTALTGALDDAGRPLFPAIGPSNADGTVANRYASLNVNGVPFLPAWALAATGTVAASSYLFDRDAVDGWATPPRQLLMPEIEVAHVYVGIWGYKATAINDINGVREITYDPVA